MNSLIDGAISHSRMVLAILIAALIAGGFTYVNLPKEADPDIPIPFVGVTVPLEGVSPEDAEQAHLIFDPYTIINARIGLQHRNQEIALFVNNLTNTAANFGNIFSVAIDTPGRNRYATNRPLTIGFQSRLFF